VRILFVNACVRGEQSRTLGLCREALAELKERLPQAQVEEVCLDTENIGPLRSGDLAQRNVLEEAGEFSHPLFRYARQFAQADVILMGTPYWEYQFPALLRCYLEHISVCGITFAYGENGASYGKCQGKHLLYVTTSGGPIGDKNCGYDYVRTLCGEMLGVRDFSFVSAQGLDVWGADVPALLAQAREDLRKTIRSWAL
jgi:FMN-dependent NADH-azoreductase